MGGKAIIDGIAFEKTSLQGALEKAEELIGRGEPSYVVTPNPEILYQALKDETLHSALREADLVLPDSVGCRIASKILGDPIPYKVAGVEFGEALLKLAAEKGYTVWFLGAKPGVAEKAGENMKAKYPGLKLLGTSDGYFKDVGPVLEKIRQSGAQILFVCLGAPKQESFIYDHKHETGAILHLALGGSLDVYAGTVERAPRWMIQSGLEWLYRLIKEPKRIGRMTRIPLYLLHCVKVRLNRRNRGK